ncbi:YlmH/Sll1252 family protein [Kallipyga massiliensis]|uniref:YlmH/Sll1252 family protein n=1 Tax=Kallipyga massiliensis TaxID=1472764 RepID=UPI0026F2F371|nr:YlmH/Sll1252 family protein [Kallipyga massiliensis]
MITDRFEDLAQMAYTQGRPLDSDFLTPEEFSEFLTIKDRLSYAQPTVYQEDWERKLVHFGPGQPDLALLEITSTAPSFVRLAHPDYLGALLGLGLDRKVTGDIIAFPDKAYVYVKGHVVDFITDNLNQVGRARVEVRVIEDLPEEARPKSEEVQIIVSSLRLDRVVSTLFRLSRGKAQEAIREGLVYVDGLQMTRDHYTIEEGQRISFRHKGKARFLEVVTETKKGSLVLSFLRYS